MNVENKDQYIEVEHNLGKELPRSHITILTSQVKTQVKLLLQNLH